MEKKAKLLTDFRTLYHKMAWLNSYQMKDARFKDYKSSEIHCIEAIGQNTDSNVTKLAESFYMTRGAISKLTKKLIKKGAIESYQKPDNKKEVYFRLTEQGQEIFDVHMELHNEFNERDAVVFDKITEEQYDMMLGFMNEYSRHLDQEIKKQGIEIKS